MFNPEHAVTNAKIDNQRCRKFRGVIRKALGASDEVADILATTDGLLVTLKSGERFTIWVENKTGR